mmetsp:Transcript_13580/g.30010  ORF Transcript_13580/g.30010 Transcript_13580/m.30010 type:complete len:214 (+) Transcript_13580:170-811(+)
MRITVLPARFHHDRHPLDTLNDGGDGPRLLHNVSARQDCDNFAVQFHSRADEDVLSTSFVDRPPLWGMRANQVLRSSSPRSISCDPTAWLDWHPNAPVAFARNQHAWFALLLEKIACHTPANLHTGKTDATAHNQVLSQVATDSPPAASATFAPGDHVAALTRFTLGDVAASIIFILIIKVFRGWFFARWLENLRFAMLGIHCLETIIWRRKS